MRNILGTLFLLSLMLVVVLSVGCGGGGGGGASPVAPTTTGSLADLRGTVTYLGKAVPNASVFLLKPTENVESLKMRASVLAQPKPDFSVLMANGSGYQTLANEKGEYLFSQVPVGTYTLTAQAGENTQISQSVILGAISSLDLALAPTGDLTGTIVYGFTDTYNATVGQPVIGEFFGLAGTPYVSWTQNDGTIIFKNIPVRATPYTIIPVYQSWLAFKGTVTASPVAGTSTPFGTKEVILAEATIKGVAKLPSGPVSGITVSTNRGDTAQTDANGNYELLGVSLGKSLLTYSYYSGESYTAQQEVTLTSVATMTLPDVILQPASANQARVDVGLDGLISGGGTVYFYLWKEGESSYYSYNYSSNPATFPYLVGPGTWYVEVAPGPNYNFLNPAPGSTNLLASITLSPAGNASFVARLQYNKANLTGTVSGVDPNFPLSYAYLYPNGNSSYFGGGNSFSFTGINPGVHSIYISAPGYRVSSTAVTLTAGANTRAVTLTPIFPTVTGGTFTDPTLTVTGTRFDVSTASIWLELGALPVGTVQVTPTTRTATQMTCDTSSLPPGQYYAYARGQDYAMSTGFYPFSKPFTADVAITSTESDVTSSTFLLRWNSYPGTANYVVSQTGGPSYTVSNTTYSQLFTNLQPNTSYTFTIYATGYGISNSMTMSTTFTTKKVYQTPVALDTGIAYTSFYGSQTKNGAVFSVIQDTATWKLVKLDLNTQAVTTATLTPPGGQSIQTFYVNTSPYNSDIYVVWAGGTGVTVQQFMFLTLSESTNLFTSTFPGTYGAAQGAQILTPADDPYALRILTWGTYGDLSPTFIASYSVVNTNLAGAVETPAPLTYVNPTNNGMMWTPIKGSDGADYYAMVYSGSVSPEYDLYASDSTTLEDTASLSGKYDLTASPLGGVVLCDGNRSYYMKPPSAFGGFSFSTSGPQAVVDNAGRFYFYQAGVQSTLQRYSSTGALLDASDFKDGLTPSFGKKCIVYDASTNQVLVAQDTDTSTLGFAAFSTAE
ncbi:MAG TPA: hypothetical protein PLP29_09210 [Candidatus Ozemobacteraceae bacterium]|nr:hypothetical protein [Candidatus Ozemobacteraceae bacterium]